MKQEAQMWWNLDQKFAHQNEKPHKYYKMTHTWKWSQTHKCDEIQTKNPYTKMKNRNNITKWPIHENEAKRTNVIESKPKDINAKLN
jgi:hypothetical protein